MHLYMLAITVLLVAVTLRRWTRETAGTATSASSTTDTEFTCEVVRVTEVSPHPNADRLELARFELKGSGVSAYEVVVQKGTTQPGALMAYFSVDCVLPTAHQEFQFLAREGRTHHRLRAARLRGVFSQGLLVPAPDTHAFGDRVDETFGVTYHRDPEPEERGPTPATAKPRSQPMPIYGVESLKKVPRLFEEGEQVVVTEKIHGTNFRFGWVPRKLFGVRIGWRFVCGSHRVMKEPGQGGFYGEDLWTKAADRMDLRHKTRNHKGLAFYGELYGHTYSGARIQDLTYGRAFDSGPGLAIFDVKRISGDEWLGARARQGLLSELGLPEVPLLYVGEYIPDLLEMAEGNTVVGPNVATQIREGIVIESLATRKKAKFVGQNYLLRKEAVA
jgi:RNA ligase (TIGR02306 family)